MLSVSCNGDTFAKLSGHSQFSNGGWNKVDATDTPIANRILTPAVQQAEAGD